MNAVQAILLAVPAAVFIYLGIAMFKPERAAQVRAAAGINSCSPPACHRGPEPG